MVQLEQPQSLQVPKSQVAHRILKATGALMIIQVILKGFGLIEKMIIGRVFFGPSTYMADAYFAAKDIAFYVFQLVDQVVMHSFLPAFVQRMRDRGSQDAWRVASTTLNLLVLLMAIVAVVGMFYAPQILHALMPDWFKPDSTKDPRLVALTIQLTRIMLAAVIFLSTSSLTYCLLNSYKQFALPQSADLALKGSVLVFAIILAKSWGPVALGVGFVAGALLKLGVHLFGLRIEARQYRPVLDVKNPGFTKFLWLALPLACGVILSIFRQAMDNRFTSSLPEGSLSALKFAKTLCDTPVQIFPFVFGIALFPFLADIAAAGDKDRLRSMLMTATRMMLLIFIPLAITVILLRVPLVVAVFGKHALMTAWPLLPYAVGMIIGALEIIVLQFYFALSDTLRPTIIGMAMVPLHIGASYLGVYEWKWGMIGIAMALLFSKGTKIIILYTVIRQRFGSLEGWRTLVSLGKVILAAIPLVAILAAAILLLPEPQHAAGKIHMALALLPFAAAAGIGMAAYFLVLYLLGSDEINLLLQKVAGKLLKSRKVKAEV